MTSVCMFLVSCVPLLLILYDISQAPKQKLIETHRNEASQKLQITIPIQFLQRKHKKKVSIIFNHHVQQQQQ